MRAEAEVSGIEFCAFDLETTGISPFSKIVEIGGVLFKPGGKGKTFSTLVAPGQPIPEGATAVHGITDDMVAGAPDVAETIDLFFNFAGSSVLLAHSAGFDVGVLTMELARNRVAFPPNHVLDTVEIARCFIPGLRNYKLDTLVRHLGLETRGLHRALQDAIAVRGIFEYAIKGSGQRTLQLQDLMNATSVYSIGNLVETDVVLPMEFSCILVALETQSVLTFIYDGGNKGTAPRRLTPVSLFERRGVAYMEAYCHEDNMKKSYRIDRIVEIIESE